jgi:hypothetical protein
MPVAVAWNVATARAVYRATMRRIGDWYNAADVFDRPSLKRVDIVAADDAVQVAWWAQDDAALRTALARWEQSITGGPVCKPN